MLIELFSIYVPLSFLRMSKPWASTTLICLTHTDLSNISRGIRPSEIEVFLVYIWYKTSIYGTRLLYMVQDFYIWYKTSIYGTRLLYMVQDNVLLWHVLNCMLSHSIILSRDVDFKFRFLRELKQRAHSEEFLSHTLYCNMVLFYHPCSLVFVFYVINQTVYA